MDSTWELLSYDEKNLILYNRQCALLEKLLQRGAISQEQHDKSLHDLIEHFQNTKNKAD